MPDNLIIIDTESSMWNQNGKFTPEEGFPFNISSENFPIKIKKDEIEYVVDRGFVTYGYDSVKEIFIKLLYGELVLINKCAKSFLSQFDDTVLFNYPSSVEFG